MDAADQVRELLLGSAHFNELRRGVPRMSPTLLSKRLRTLERSGVLRRHVGSGGTTYQLTACGEELYDVVQGLGLWGLKWISVLGEDDLDAHLLMWDIRRTIPAEDWPSRRTTVAIVFRDRSAHAGRWWLTVAHGEADACDTDPGYGTDILLETSLPILTRIWRGEATWSECLRVGAVVLTGPDHLLEDVPRWIGRSALSAEANRRMTTGSG